MAPELKWNTPPTPQQEENRAKLHACTGWILAMHMHELHPLLWARAQIQPNPTQKQSSRKFQIARGRQIALQVIISQFADQLANGAMLNFSPS
jgi:hypothetical protein